MNNNHKAILYSIAILLAMGSCIYLIHIGILHEISLLFLLFGVYPWCKNVWDVYNTERHIPTRILKELLPKCGFNIEKTEWNEEKNFVQYWGKYQGDNFLIEASTQSLYINIYDLPWNNIKSSDSSITSYIEAINDTNALNPNMSVVMCHPDENNMRDIYTYSRTILPDYQAEIYLEHLMCDMLNCKNTFAECLKKDRPWLNAKKSPIGFHS